MNNHREIIETLLVNRLIVLSPPRPEIGCQYNCYRLTTEGQAKLAELAKKLFGVTAAN